MSEGTLDSTGGEADGAMEETRENLGSRAEPTVTDLYDSEIEYPPVPTEEEIEAHRSTKALRTPPRADVNLDVPYVHQLWDTPSGFNGHWACGPTSAAMVLAYYGLLEPKPLEVPQPEPHTSDYGWYISNTFTHNGKTFDAESKTKTGSATGLYGAVVDKISEKGWGAYYWPSKNGKGIGPLMDAFLKPVGNKVSFQDGPKRGGTRYMEQGAAESAMKACLDAGHPVIVSGFFQDEYDHLIVVRGYYADESGLHWIVNDPYGFETTGKGFDGGNVVYEFDEINPKLLCLFSGSTVPQRVKNNLDHINVRLFDKNTNEQIGEGTLIKGTDKVYIKRLEP